MKPLLIICGPTAIGKSALAMELAEKIGGEIISADSGQVWRELDIGTAKPNFHDLRRVPHHLIDVVGPGDHFDASLYTQLADAAIASIIERGKQPILVGGCGLYIQVLLKGLCEAPAQDKEIREQLHQRLKEEGIEAMFASLQKCDPVTAGKIHPNDKTRIIRALEVYEITGEPLASFHEKHQFQKPRYEAKQFGLTCEREELYKRIEKRIDWMMSNGWDEETRELLRLYKADSQAMQCLGYVQLVRYLRGELPLAEAVEEIKKQTRNYAKRQLTWFKKEKTIQWLSPTEALTSLLLACRRGR
ncbi:MAG: tRNA (adenosine(37)-N6)-dimethylallyltransferase MiaA [Deltaproteobacteria bacterium]|nr:tRNA (adenosine(37)-N6)-dimethylallyltransferase MiaA [Deltaproteobacteria bacterium]